MLNQLFNKPSLYHRGYSFFNSRFYSSKSSRCVRVSTIDHDGCFGLQYMDPSEVSEMHAPIIDAMGEQKKTNGYDVDYVMSYSNRQSIRRDCLNAINNKNNLAFPVAAALARALGAYFDPLLLADIYAEKKPGATISDMKLAISKRGITLKSKISDEVITELMKESTTDYIFSEDKINILYPQLHRMALIHPKALISFHIYDDLVEEVLQPSTAFFAQHPQLIPSNVTLHFYYFNTLREEIHLPTKISTLSGKGAIDENYYKTAMVMGEIAKKEEGEHISKYKMVNYLSPEKILEELSENYHSRFRSGS